MSSVLARQRRLKQEARAKRDLTLLTFHDWLQRFNDGRCSPICSYCLRRKSVRRRLEMLETERELGGASENTRHYG